MFTLLLVLVIYLIGMALVHHFLNTTFKSNITMVEHYIINILWPMFLGIALIAAVVFGVLYFAGSIFGELVDLLIVKLRRKK